MTCPVGRTTSDVREMVRLYESGLTMKQVGERVGCSTTRVHHYLHMAGVKPRTAGRFGTKHPIIGGRRNCSACRRWLHIHNFQLRDDRGQIETQCRSCRQALKKKCYAAKREEYREYYRIYSERRRRENGAHPRQFSSRRGGGDYELLPIAPLHEWLARKCVEYETKKGVARACGVDEKVIRRLMGVDQETVTLELADKLLTREGSTMLWELWPDADG